MCILMNEHTVAKAYRAREARPLYVLKLTRLLNQKNEQRSYPPMMYNSNIRTHKSVFWSLTFQEKN